MRAVFLFLGLSACCQAQPVIDAVTNSASYTGRISLGGLGTFFGTGFTTGVVQATTVPLQTTLGGISMTINSYPCPLLYVSATQINFQVPYEATAGQNPFVLTAATGTFDGILDIDESAPALFQYGTNLALAVNYSTGAINAANAPVSSGDYLIVYLTGIGPVSNSPGDGSPASGTSLSSATNTYSATIGGVSANLTFLGLTPGLVGLGQANVQVPTLGDGNYPLVIVVNGVTSTSAVVSVSGTGPVAPNILTYVSSVGVPTQVLQGNIHGTRRVQVNGQYAYVCSDDQITVVNILSPQSPVSVSAFGESQLNGLGTNCVISNNYLVELIDADSFVMFDLASSPTDPPVVAGPVTLQEPLTNRLVFDGNTLLLDTGGINYSGSTNMINSEIGDLQAYDFTNFASPAFASVYQPPSNFTQNTSIRYNIAPINSQYVVVAGTTNTGGAPTSGSGVFDVLDVSNPADIVGVLEVPVSGNVVLQDVALQSNLALMTGNTGGINNPIVYSDNGSAEFATTGNLTLTTVDFTVPQSPVVLSSSATAMSSAVVPWLVSLGGGYFAISNVRSYSDYNGAGAFAVVDAVNASSPVWIPIATIDGVAGMAVQNGYLYVTTGAGLSIYSINAGSL